MVSTCDRSWGWNFQVVHEGCLNNLFLSTLFLSSFLCLFIFFFFFWVLKRPLSTSLPSLPLLAISIKRFPRLHKIFVLTDFFLISSYRTIQTNFPFIFVLMILFLEFFKLDSTCHVVVRFLFTFVRFYLCFFDGLNVDPILTKNKAMMVYWLPHTTSGMD